MKKKFLLILTVSMGLMLSACSQENIQTETNATEQTKSTQEETKSSDETYLQLNETMTYENWEFTLTNVEFAEELNTDTSDDDKFMLPLAEGENNPAGEDLGEFTVQAHDDTILLAYEFQCKFIGKTTVDDSFDEMGAPHVYYGDGYEFDGRISQEYTNFVLPTDDPIWHLLGYTSEDVYFSYRIPMPMADGTYEPLENALYKVRGYITLPRETYENADEPLSISFRILWGETDKYIVR